MENLTHSLLGATLAEVALPPDATIAQRRLFFVAGIVAANLPDADLLYTGIAPPPLGYLLHHRGYTHTVIGCALLALGVWMVTRIIPSVHGVVAQSSRRFGILIGAALASHLVADWWNSYGVHPFWPIDNRWIYGDAIYILEPWFWIILGAAAVVNTRSRAARAVLAVALIALLIALTSFHMISIGIFVALVCGGGVLAAMAIPLSPRTRSNAALAAVGVFVVVSFGLSHVARAASLASPRADAGGEILDIVLSPKLARPLCWSALLVERVDPTDEYVMRRGNVALFPGLDSCGSVRVGGGSIRHGFVTWDMIFRESSSKLRDRSRDDCWVRAWLQFGRAPVLREAVIADARYDDPSAGGFTEMRLRPLAEARVCPRHLTNWAMPRADLLRPR